MKKIIFIVSCFGLWISPLVAQLYVGNSSFVFNKGALLYAGGNLELNGAASNLYLRNGGQFLQATTGLSANKGVGKLSINNVLWDLLSDISVTILAIFIFKESL